MASKHNSHCVYTEIPELLHWRIKDGGIANPKINKNGEKMQWNKTETEEKKKEEQFHIL